MLPDYAEEVKKMFLGHIRTKATQASDRNQYKAVCRIIREYAKACQKAEADKIINELKQQHARRPAFIEELNNTKN